MEKQTKLGILLFSYRSDSNTSRIKNSYRLISKIRSSNPKFDISLTLSTFYIVKSTVICLLALFFISTTLLNPKTFPIITLIVTGRKEIFWAQFGWNIFKKIPYLKPWLAFIERNRNLKHRDYSYLTLIKLHFTLSFSWNIPALYVFNYLTTVTMQPYYFKCLDYNKVFNIYFSYFCIKTVFS